VDVIALWTGYRASTFRVAYRLTVEGFAEKLGAAVRTVAKWEAQPEIIPTPALQAALDTTLEQAAPAVRSRLSLLLAECEPGQNQPRGSSLGDDIGRAVGAMQAFRMADVRVGGGHLYPAITSYLRDQVAPQLVDVDEGPAGNGIFVAAAAITEMAGWMAHDAGNDGLARGHFTRSLQLVRAGGDRRVQAHILASMSHLEEHLRRPGVAIRLARAGLDALAEGPRSPDLEARLYAVEARARAALHDGNECVRLLGAAEKAIHGPQDEEPSGWVSGFDEGALANETARCMRHLGDLGEVRRQTTIIVALRPASRPRSRAFGLLMLAAALAGDGQHEEACVVASEVLDVPPALGSHIVVQQLCDLASLLEPHRSAGHVSGFLTRLDSDIRQRLWLFRQIGNDGQGLPLPAGVSA
jgi:hypothetical protein